MASWYEMTAEEFAEIYASIPKIACKGLCADACGPIDMNPWERLQLRRAGFKLPPHREQLAIREASPDGHYRCPALTDDERCGAYDARPTVCRIWGIFDGLRCQYGCPIEGGEPLSTMGTMALLERASLAGTPEEPHTEEEFRKAYESNPDLAEKFDQLISAMKPTKTRKIPKD